MADKHPRRDIDTVNGRHNSEIMLALSVPGDDAYHPCAEAYPADDVPRSSVLRFKHWDGSTIFAGTQRELWISVPADLDSPSLLVCQDGLGYAAKAGPVRAINVLDSLAHAGVIRPTVGVFVMPGAPAGASADEAQKQRSLEYDSPSDDYVRFINEEVLPFVEQQIGTQLTNDPGQRTACGISSGGICAFNMAWQRPDSFGRVISHCGSFTAIRGGHEFPVWIRTTERKPIKVYMQSGSNDADIPLGSWPLANQLVADALKFAGYDYRFDFGTGGHNLAHGGATFASALRYLESGSAARTTAGDAAFREAAIARIKQVRRT